MLTQNVTFVFSPSSCKSLFVDIVKMEWTGVEWKGQALTTLLLHSVDLISSLTEKDLLPQKAFFLVRFSKLL